MYVSGCICVHTYTVLLGLSKVWCPTPLLWAVVGSSRSSRSRSGSGVVVAGSGQVVVGVVAVQSTILLYSSTI